ncbi:unnamed protein product [Cunninghamella blakesleeana]
MSQSTFDNQQNWLGSDELISIDNQATFGTTETDKRKWDELGDLPTEMSKHFNSNDNELILPTSQDMNDISEQNLSPSELRQKRKEQNRVAQRAFRERKERYVKELEEKIKQLEKEKLTETQQLKEENATLKLKVKQMEAEVYTLKGAEQAFKLSIQKLKEAGVQIPDTTPHPLISANHMLNLPNSNVTTFSSSTSASSTTSNNMTTASSFSPYSSSSLSMVSTSSPSHIDPIVYSDEDSHHQLPSHHSTFTPSSPTSSITSHVKSEVDDFPVTDFAESKTERFNHQPDPLVLAGAKTIPYSQIWEKLQDHPIYDLIDMDTLCEELKTKARCSGSGAVILEDDLKKVLEKYEYKI